VGRLRLGLGSVFHVGRLRLGSRVVARLGSGVWVSASFPKKMLQDIWRGALKIQDCKIVYGKNDRQHSKKYKIIINFRNNVKYILINRTITIIKDTKHCAASLQQQSYFLVIGRNAKKTVLLIILCGMLCIARTVLSQDVRVSVRLSHASIVSQRLNAEQIKLFQLNHRL